jgi:hypothetical protein
MPACRHSTTPCYRPNSAQRARAPLTNVLGHPVRCCESPARKSRLQAACDQTSTADASTGVVDPFAELTQYKDDIFARAFIFYFTRKISAEVGARMTMILLRLRSSLLERLRAGHAGSSSPRVLLKCAMPCTCIDIRILTNLC